MERYTIKDFNKEFPTEKSCANYLFKLHTKLNNKCKCGKSIKNYYYINSRKIYACSCGEQLNPRKNTILFNSSTPLKLWFYAIYLFSVSKNGVSAKELERQLGVTYKTAWRMANKIRSLMETDNQLIKNSTIEVDETYIGGKEMYKHKNKKIKHTQGRSTLTKTPVIGIVDRDTGKVKAKVVSNVRESEVNTFIGENVSKSSRVISDEYRCYSKLNQRGWEHQKVNHGNKEYAIGDIHTNTIEGFWSIIKRGIKGTYIQLSNKYLQTYIDEFVFRYNNRNKIIFNEIIGRIV